MAAAREVAAGDTALHRPVLPVRRRRLRRDRRVAGDPLRRALSPRDLRLRRGCDPLAQPGDRIRADTRDRRVPPVPPGPVRPTVDEGPPCRERPSAVPPLPPSATVTAGMLQTVRRHRIRLGNALVALGAAALAGVPTVTLALAPRPAHRAIAATASGTAPATATPPGGRPPAVPSPAPRVLYRPIGCVLRGPAIAYSNCPHHKTVALSFDDGPWSDTSAFVRLLEAEHVTATFFMIGDQLSAR